MKVLGNTLNAADRAYVLRGFKYRLTQENRLARPKEYAHAVRCVHFRGKPTTDARWLATTLFATQDGKLDRAIGYCESSR